MFRLSARAAVVLMALTICLPLRSQISPETGSFVYHNYSAKDYNASPQNWVISQDFRGVMYVGNTSGVLEFDGVYWRLIPLTGGAGAQSLAVDSTGTVFVGGDNLLGYLAPDQNGTTVFNSLLGRLPQADRTFGTIWDILPTADGVYFCSHRRLFLLSKDPAVAAKVWKPTQRFGRAFAAYEELFVTTTDHGLQRMVNSELIPSLQGDDKLVRKSPVFALGAHPLLANSRGLFHFSLSSIDPFPTAADAYFGQHDISSINQWPGGEIAVGTTSGGVVLLDQTGAILRILNRKSGLPSDTITAFYQDRQGGIWIATDAGMARFETSVSSFTETQGLLGSVTAVGRGAGALYAGTSLGLFRLNAAAGEKDPEFVPVSGLQDAIRVIAEQGGVALVGAKRGLYAVSGAQARQVLSTDVVYDVSFSRKDPELVYIAGRDGVQALKPGKTWTVVGKESKGQEFRMVLEDDDGRVWAITRSDIWRIDLRVQPALAERFGAAEGVPGDFKYVYLLNGHVVFATAKGLLRFSESNKRFVPDPEIGSQFSDGSLPVSNVAQDLAGNLWLAGLGYNGVLLKQKAGGYQWLPQPLSQTGINEMYALQPDNGGVVWASGDGGALFRYQMPSARQRAPDFRVLLRRVLATAQEHVLFGGDGIANFALRLPYSDNAVRFEFAAPFPENQSSVQYQVKLDGTDKQWSPWTTETRKDYTNLPERAYAFHVRARNAHNVVNTNDAFAFSVRPPWYRTWIAYVVYVIGFLYAGWLILRWRIRSLEAKNKWLEHVVEERTAEVRSERDQNEALLLNILPAPVASELRSTGAVKPTAFEDVTVCFSDFVGFTLSSEKMPAEELISSLNEYFTAFDEIIGRYGLEKLKTIGDAYMFASGLPNKSPSHAVDAVLAALEMVAASRRLARPDKGVTWRIRLGLYSGPVVAGVVGKRKFAFDIWGNTVNFAARMESSGAADRVNLSQTTCRLVSDFIECEPRGPVRIKEGREMEMFFANGPRLDLLAGPLVDGIPKAFKERYEEAYSTSPKSFPDPAIFSQPLLESLRT